MYDCVTSTPVCPQLAVCADNCGREEEEALRQQCHYTMQPRMRKMEAVRVETDFPKLSPVRGAFPESFVKLSSLSSTT